MIGTAAAFFLRAKGWLKRWRPEIVALVAVVAVSGIGAAILGHQLLRSQNQRIADLSTQVTDLTNINKGWKDWAAEEAARNARSHNAVLAMQGELEHLRELTASNDENLARLEKTNAEVLQYLNRPIPDDLRRMLQ